MSSPLTGEYRVEDLFRCKPKYAVVQIDDRNNVAQLFRDLLDKGFNNVRFFDDLCEHPVVRERISKLIELNNPLDIDTIGSPAKLQKLVKSQKVDIPKTIEDSGDGKKPMMFPVQVSERAGSRKRMLYHGGAGGLNSTCTSSIASSSSPQDYDQTIDQVIGKATLDPAALVSNLFAMEKALLLPSQSAQGLTQSSATVTPLMMKRKDEPTADELVQCKKCGSKIMATRYSNLSNHVRRHAPMKQYQCPNCSYQNNEQAKVRLHMQNQHAETTEQVIDQFSSELQTIWGELMDVCFPNYQEILAQAKASQNKRLMSSSSNHGDSPVVENGELGAGAANGTNGINTPTNGANEEEETIVTNRQCSIYRCLECSTIVPCLNGEESLNEGPLVAHLKKDHHADCLPYKCDECGYKNAEQWKIRWHISIRHPNKADRVSVSQNKTQVYQLYLRKYFPNVQNVHEDIEEIELHDLSPSSTTPKSTVRRPIPVIPKPGTISNGIFGLLASKHKK